ncbi:glycoside hydrolase 5 family protein [Microbacterium invictum]|uniref:Cellulase family glycosylhydrolase n=1 Tax=Microbacterium invictum TaxID=515415 RepID=A0ABZ0VBF0_9MICO|nr:cellulase family glycosylhydrolase [Microbacterium invictum]WQB70671.1 cellulase family glycosylhydrolase [Microbacterium invictum]
MNTPPRFGVNYVPGSGWWYSWVDWRDDAIVADLAAIRAIGADHIRIHCLWPLFQPNARVVSSTMLDRLERLMDIATENDLDVIVTIFDGWLSGFDFRPSWLQDDQNIFADRDVIDAELRLVRALADRVGGHPAFLGFDIANEPSVIAGGPGRERNHNETTLEQGDAWLVELLGYAEEVAPSKLHSVGMDHRPWLTDDEPFSRRALGATGSVTPIHAWIYFTGALDRYGHSGTGTVHLAEFMLELAKAYGNDANRPVWLQEYGASTTWLDDPAAFLEVATAAAASVENLWGITWWCSHDISRELDGFIELEYDLGLLTVDNEVKPAGRAFRDAANLVRSGGVTVKVRDVALVLPDETTPDLTFADAFFSLIEAGSAPAIVLASRADDKEYLSKRGIRRLIEH